MLELDEIEKYIDRYRDKLKDLDLDVLTQKLIDEIDLDADNVKEVLDKIKLFVGYEFYEDYTDDEILQMEINDLERALELDFLPEDEKDRIRREVERLKRKIERRVSERVRVKAKRRRKIRTVPILEFTKILRLRDYQRDAKGKWLERRRGVIVMPTGTGKTYVAISIIQDYLKSGKRVAVIVPTIPLMRQWKSKLKEYGIESGLFYSRKKETYKVTIFVLKSALLYVDKLRRYDLIIFDEVHHLASKQCIKILSLVKDKDLLGLTASLERFDKRHYLILRYMPICYYMSLSEARERGIVARARVIEVPVELTPSEMSKYLAIESRIRRLVASADRIEEVEDELTPLLTLRRLICSNAENKVNAVLDICKFVDDRVILFSESIFSIERLFTVLMRSRVSARVYHSLMPLSKRKMTLELWRKNRFKVLLACRALDEGIDVPEVRNCIILCNSLSVRQLVQRLGRVLRPKRDVVNIYVIYAKNTYEERVKDEVKKLLKVKGL